MTVWAPYAAAIVGALLAGVAAILRWWRPPPKDVAEARKISASADETAAAAEVAKADSAVAAALDVARAQGQTWVHIVEALQAQRAADLHEHRTERARLEEEIRRLELRLAELDEALRKKRDQKHAADNQVLVLTAQVKSLQSRMAYAKQVGEQAASDAVTLARFTLRAMDAHDDLMDVEAFGVARRIEETFAAIQLAFVEEQPTFEITGTPKSEPPPTP